jgi:hypothetical protein
LGVGAGFDNGFSSKRTGNPFCQPGGWITMIWSQNYCACRDGVENGLEMLIGWRANSAFSPVFALSRLRSLILRLFDVIANKPEAWPAGWAGNRDFGDIST